MTKRPQKSRRYRRPPRKDKEETSISSYQHEGLYDNKFFRLLELLPGKEGTPIQVRLQIYSINFHPPYDAISYVWGHPDDKKAILCNCKRLFVPISLCEALGRLRDERENRILWADSICINQQSFEERGHQVQLMRKIFMQAECVKAWLGQCDVFDAPVAVNHIEHLHNSWVAGGDEMLKKEAHATSGYELYHIVALLTNPWFSRVWIIQEVGLASSALLMCGTVALEWEKLATLLITIPQEIELPMNVLYNGYLLQSHLGRLGLLTTDFRTIEDADVRFILSMARTWICSDSRDHVYALLGHAGFSHLEQQTGGQARMQVDYSDSVSLSDVSFNVAMVFLEVPDPLYVLSMVEHTLSSIEDRETPSWVPQMDKSNGQATIAGILHGPRTWAGTAFEPQFTVRKQVLEVKAISLDSVKWTSAKFLSGASLDVSILISIWNELKRKIPKRRKDIKQLLIQFCSTVFLVHSGIHTCYPWGFRTLKEHISNCLAFFNVYMKEDQVVKMLISEYGLGDEMKFAEFAFGIIG